jgi:hypothetical protein
MNSIIEKIIIYQYFSEISLLVGIGIIGGLYILKELKGTQFKKIKIEKKHLIAIFLFITGIKTQFIISDFIYNALLAQAKIILADGQIEEKEIFKYTMLVFFCRFIEYMMIFCTLNPTQTFGKVLTPFINNIKKIYDRFSKDEIKLAIAETEKKIDLLLKNYENTKSKNEQ